MKLGYTRAQTGVFINGPPRDWRVADGTKDKPGHLFRDLEYPVTKRWVRGAWGRTQRAGCSSSCFLCLPSSIPCSRGSHPEGVTQNAGAHQAGKREVCASLHPPPNSLELFTLFSLPFLHFYNFLGTQVEWSGGRSLVLSAPARGPLSPFFSFFSSSRAPSRASCGEGIRVFFLLGWVYSEA